MDISFFLFVASVLFLLFCCLILFVFHKRSVYQKDQSDEIALLITAGIRVFLKRVVLSLCQVTVYLVVFIWIFSVIFNQGFPIFQIGAFVIGFGVLSLALYFSLLFIPRMIPRIMHLCKVYVTDVISLLYQSTAMISFFIIGVCLLGFAVSYLIFGHMSIIGYCFGGMLAAYFFRIGGSVFKGAATIAANVTSSAHHEIPFFDQRNPAILMDIAGDLVGSVSGFAADVFSSFLLVFAASILFPQALFFIHIIDATQAKRLHHLSFLIIASAMFISVLSFLFSLFRIKKQYSNFLLEGVYFSIVITGGVTFFIIEMMNIHMDVSLFWGIQGYFSLFWPYLIGLTGAVLIAFTSEFLTSRRFVVAQQVARQAESGVEMLFFGAFSNALKSTGVFLVYLLFIIIPSFLIAGFYGIIMAGVGMLSIVPTIMLTTMFSPIAASIHHTAVITDAHPTVVAHSTQLQQLGGTTASLGNGFSSGVAVIASLCMLLYMIVMLHHQIEIRSLLYVDMKLFLGLLVGIAMPFVFSGFLLKGLTQGIQIVKSEVVRQFCDIPYLLEGKARPDIEKAADQNAIYSMNALTIPTVVMLLVPFLVGYILGLDGFKFLYGIILGTFLVGSQFGFLMGNMGDMLSQVRLYMESGHLGGVGTRSYQAVCQANTIGEGFNGLIAPAINILIKSISVLAILVIYFLVSI